jgi:hypothetical protein
MARLQVRIPDQYEPGWLTIRKRPQQNPIQKAENCGVCADPERQGEHRYDSEEGLFPEGSNGKPQILHGGFDGPATQEVGSASLIHRDLPEQRKVRQHLAGAQHDRC